MKGDDILQDSFSESSDLGGLSRFSISGPPSYNSTLAYSSPNYNSLTFDTLSLDIYGCFNQNTTPPSYSYSSYNESWEEYLEQVTAPHFDVRGDASEGKGFGDTNQDQDWYRDSL